VTSRRRCENHSGEYVFEHPAPTYSASPSAAHHAPTDEESYQARVVVSIAILVFTTFAFLLGTLAQQAGQEHAAEPTAAHHATTNEQLQDIPSLIVFAVVFVSALAQQVREEHATKPTATQDATGDQRFHRTPLVAFVVLVLVAFVFGPLAAVAQQLGQDGAADAAPA
jgi:heme/copper-type cytochrome/quinol oxidase subunit 2